MTVQPDYAPTVPCMTFEQLVERVRSEGAYATPERAEAAVRDVLAGLGRQLRGEERVALASRLPFEAAVVFTAQVPAIEPLTGWNFVKELVNRTGGTHATARWDVGSVLRVITRSLDDELIDRIIAQLPPGYALHFGRAELHTATRETAGKAA